MLNNFFPLSSYHNHEDYRGVQQKSSTLIGQLATVHICDWLTKIAQIYEHGMAVTNLLCFRILRVDANYWLTRGIFGAHAQGAVIPRKEEHFWLLSNAHFVHQKGFFRMTPLILTLIGHVRNATMFYLQKSINGNFAKL